MSGGTLSLHDAMGVLRDARTDRDVIVTTMGAARDWMALGPLHPLDLVFVPSSMGQATSVGLGLALARPDLRVVVVNGDGSMLMNLGSLVTIAAESPPNLSVVVAENGVYEVTGAQPTPGRAAGTDLEAVARGCGITRTRRCIHLDEWRSALPTLLGEEGPQFAVLEVAVVPGGMGPRSPGPAAERARRFAEALAGA